MQRLASLRRTTSETDIELTLNLDGIGASSIATGVGFLDHMLTLFSRHAGWSLNVVAKGDHHIDDHHTVEDVGICMGQALLQALGDKRGIHRYGHMTLPMDETLVTAAVDLSGRFALVWKVEIPVAKIGTFDSELALEFWNAFAQNARMNLHVLLHHGGNGHHIVEAIFKGVARALRMAVAKDLNQPDVIPSTKGSLV